MTMLCEMVQNFILYFTDQNFLAKAYVIILYFDDPSPDQATKCILSPYGYISADSSCKPAN